MKSKSALLSVSFASALMLAACGTDTANETPVDNDDTDVTITEEADGQTGSGETETPSADEKPAAPEKEEKPAEETASDESADEAMKDAVKTASDEQDYSISVLPGYTLTSEEPGRDSLVADEDGSIFMRIETMNKADVEMEEIISQTKESLSASSDGKDPLEVTDTALLPKGETIANTKVYQVEASEVNATGIVFEQGEKVVRLTIYDSKDNKHYENFLHMGETIE